VISPALPTLYVVGTGIAAWVVAMLAVAAARRRAGAPTSAVVLLVVAALSFGFDHGFPTGTIGMAALFAAGLLWSGVRRPVPWGTWSTPDLLPASYRAVGSRG
jgi:hypothetical protein